MIALGARRRERCFRGHLFTALTRYMRRDGASECRICRDAATARSAEAIRSGLREPKQRKTHCLRGHALTPENTYRTSTGHRGCVECRFLLRAKYAENARQRSAARRANAAPSSANRLTAVDGSSLPAAKGSPGTGLRQGDRAQ